MRANWIRQGNLDGADDCPVTADSPLCGRGGDTDDHNGGIGQDLLQGFIVLALVQIVAQFLNGRHTQDIMFKLHARKQQGKKLCFHSLLVSFLL